MPFVQGRTRVKFSVSSLEAGRQAGANLPMTPFPVVKLPEVQTT